MSEENIDAQIALANRRGQWMKENGLQVIRAEISLDEFGDPERNKLRIYLHGGAEVAFCLRDLVQDLPWDEYLDICCTSPDVHIFGLSGIAIEEFDLHVSVYGILGMKEPECPF